MTVLVDSWAWIEYFKGSVFGEKAKKYIESDEEVIVSAINISEMYTFLLRNKPDEAQKFMDFVLQRSFAVPIETSIALAAAKIKVEKKFGLADALVLATARQHKCPVVTGDDDFKNEEEAVYIGS